MMNLLLVGCGGFLGAMARYGLSGWMQKITDTSHFPIGTVTVNLFGCLIIGIIGGLVESRQLFSPEVRIFILIGFIGSFTTFSTLSFEFFQLVRDHQYLSALVYTSSQIIIGFIAVWFGFVVARLIGGSV